MNRPVPMLTIEPERFLVLGRAGMDFYADPPGTELERAEQFTAALGGSAANIAAGICKLGGAASLITALSDDAVGRFVHRQLGSYGVGTEHVHWVRGEARTSLAVVETRAEQCQSVIYRNGAADFALSAAQAAAVDWAGYGGLIVTGTALAAEPSRGATLAVMAAARQLARPVVIDLDYRAYSWGSDAEAAGVMGDAVALSDVVIGNDVEFGVLARGGDGLALAGALPARLTVYKRGEAGAVTFAAGAVLETGIFRVRALKPTGAGDAFMAGFITGLTRGADLMTCLRRGSAAAAIVVTRVGCAPASPDENELNRFLAGHPEAI